MTPTLRNTILVALVILFFLVANASGQTIAVFPDSSSQSIASAQCEDARCSINTESKVSTAVNEVVSKIPARKSSALEVDGFQIRITYSGSVYTVSVDGEEEDATYTNAANMRAYIRKRVDAHLGIVR